MIVIETGIYGVDCIKESIKLDGDYHNDIRGWFEAEDDYGLNYYTDFTWDKENDLFWLDGSTREDECFFLTHFTDEELMAKVRTEFNRTVCGMENVNNKDKEER